MKGNMEFTKVDENSFDGTKPNVSGSYFKILDKDGIEMPDHYSGRYRYYEEAKKLLNRLNIIGEYKPYTMVKAYKQ